MKTLGMAGLLVAAVSTTAFAQAADALKTERCATRVAVSLVGKAPSTALLSSADPQSQVDTMVTSADFQERFSRFINATFNDTPGQTVADDAAYHMAKYVLANNLKWEDMFIGAYGVTVNTQVTPNTVTVNANTNGLGYFRWNPWMVRYAGNEPAGIRISTAYRMMNNTIGLKLVASTNAPTADISANGRQAAGCRACHFDGWFALDKTAAVLGKVTRSGNNVTFAASTAGPQDVLGGLTINDDKELATALVKSQAFEFRACRLAFEYLYGRAEQTCEGPIFDKCIDAFRTDGKIQTAIATVAKEASFCQ